MDYRYKQLEEELSVLSKVFSELSARLSEVAKEVASPGMVPSERVLEQISASRTSFENARTAVHSHASAMLVSPLPRLGDLMSIAAIDTLVRAAAAAEENKYFIEGEREKSLAILGRVLSIAHRDDGEFKPLLECHAKIGALRNAVSNVQWPHRHPDSEPIVGFRHPLNALLNFVENLDALDDEKWMAIEATITESYGKPLFIAASRGKLVVREVKSEASAAAALKPVAAIPVLLKAPAAEKPIEKPIEKKAVTEKAPEKAAPAVQAPVPTAPVVQAPAPVVVTSAPAIAPAAATERKVAAPPIPVAPAASAAVLHEKKEVVPERATPRPAPPVQAQPAPVPVAVAVASAPVVVAAPPAPVATAGAVPAPSASVAAVPTPTPSGPAAPVPPAPIAATPRSSAPPVPAAAPIAPIAPVQAASAISAPSVSASVPVAPAAVSGTHSAPSVATAQNASHSLVALVTATEPATDKKASGTATATLDIADKQRKEPRLAIQASHTSPRTEQIAPEMASEEEAQQANSGDGSQRPQRWGFWRGNR